MRHIIEDIDLHSPLAEQYTLCSCGATVRVSSFLTLEHAWDNHRGAPVPTGSYAPKATDSDVSEFLRAIEDPTYQPNFGDSPSATTTERDVSTVYALMGRLLEEHDPRDVYGCGVCRALNKWEASKGLRQGAWW